MTIQTFNKQNLKEVRHDMMMALEELESKFGLSIEIGKMKYSEDNVTVSVLAQTHAGEDRRAKSLEDDLKFLGITGTDNGVYKIVDVKWSNRKYPVIAEKHSTGKRYKFDIDNAKLAFNQ